MADLILIKPPASSGARIEAQDTALIFDATPSETHSQAAEVTSFPVEDGVDITDHVRARPFTMRMSATLSATPLAEADQEVDRLAKKHAEMLELVRSGQVLRVVTGLVAYDNMVVSNYQASRSANKGQSLDCSLDLQQIRRVDSVEVEIPPRILGPQVQTDGQLPRPQGDQTGTEPDANEDTRGRSILVGFADDGILGGFETAGRRVIGN